MYNIEENRIIVGVADMKLSRDTNISIATYSLGSCIGVTIYDPKAYVGGILHYMLPNSFMNKEKAKIQPFMFADTGIPLLFKTAYQMGAKKCRIIVKIAGGSSIIDKRDFFGIGRKNHEAAEKIFYKNNVTITNKSVGGEISRTVYLNIASGDVVVKCSGGIEDIFL